MNNLPVPLNNKCNHKEADTMKKQKLALKEKVFSKEHPDVLLSIYCLVHTLAKRDSFGEATILYRRACEGYSNVLSNAHGAYTEESLGILYAVLFLSAHILRCVYCTACTIGSFHLYLPEG